MMNKFYNFTNSDELYIYGDIVSDIEKYEETDTNFIDFKEKLEAMESGSTLNIYINSGGGSVVATQGIIGLLNKAKRDKEIKTRCYIDGLAASCASWLPMCCDEVYCYNTSLMMVHKPMVGFFMEMLNANELQKNIDILNKIEESMLNAYESKLKNTTREQLQQMINEETWLTANEICDLFDVTLLEDKKEFAAKVSKDTLKNYKNVPDVLKNSLKADEEPEEEKEEVTEEEEAAETDSKDVSETEEAKEPGEDVSKDDKETTEDDEEPGEEVEETEEDEEVKKEHENKLKLLNLELEMLNIF